MKTPIGTLLGILLSCSIACRAAEFDVKAHGAKGDGITLDTAAINAAIDAAAAAGGGTVEFPAGSYLTYSIHLKSHVMLHLDMGATIIAADPSPDLATGYDAPEPNPGTDQYEDFGHAHWRNSLIWGENLVDIGITGPGRIFGRGLSRGSGIKDPLPGEPHEAAKVTQDKRVFVPGPFGYPNAHDSLPAGVGNKSISLKNCRNVILRDFSIYHGGHFGILATGVDNFTLDNLTIDTNRDGMDIDCCVNVRVSNCSINSPHDDGLCLKSSFGLGYPRATENVAITNCLVSGYNEGTLLDGTRKRGALRNGGPVGRIKFGTEANGGLKNVSISNCVFDHCRGLALEEVDGGTMENITVNNLSMREIGNAPIFIRLGARLRGPNNPPVGVARRIRISNVVATDVAPESGILIAGLVGHPIEDVSLDGIDILYRGGGTAEQAARVVPEDENVYPEPSSFGVLPAWGLFARHVAGLDVRDVQFRTEQDDLRSGAMLEDVTNARIDGAQIARAKGAAIFTIKNSTVVIRSSPGLPETSGTAPIPAQTF